MRNVAACGVGFALLCSACATASVKPAMPAIPTPAFLAWSQSGVPDKRVCVLPFTDQTGTAGLATQVRESFSGHLSIKRFSDVELHEIDTRLDALASGWRHQPAQQLGKTLGCDALIYGEVTGASRLYLGLYSQLTLEGAIQVVDATSGQPLLHESYTTRFRAGAVPLSLLGVVPGALLNLRTMTDTHLIRAIDDLGRHLADRVPDLPAVLPIQHTASPTVPAPAPIAPVADAPQAPASAGQEQYRVQVATFSTHGEAQQAARLLHDKGYRPAIAESTDTRRAWHRVIVGPFPSVHEAQQVGAQIHKRLRFTPVVIRASER